jgi:prepilin-type N-terminal cleavage/methylation domain-containing protein
MQVKNTKSPLKQDGFSIIELILVLVVASLISGFALIRANRALQSYRAMANARNIAGQLALTKMRAANAFTQARLNCDLTAKSCRIEICTSKGATTCNTFTADGGAMPLAAGTSFGFGTLTTAAGTQTTIQNTAQILFNSRGIPIDNTGAATGNYALYVTSQTGDIYAVTVYASGRVGAWQYLNGAWNQQ